MVVLIGLRTLNMYWSPYGICRLLEWCRRSLPHPCRISWECKEVAVHSPLNASSERTILNFSRISRTWQLWRYKMQQVGGETARYFVIFNNFFTPASRPWTISDCWAFFAEAMLVEDVIRPPRSIVNVRLWNECYLRWIPPANVRVSRDSHSTRATYVCYLNKMAFLSLLHLTPSRIRKGEGLSATVNKRCVLYLFASSCQR